MPTSLLPNPGFRLLSLFILLSGFLFTACTNDPRLTVVPDLKSFEYREGEGRIIFYRNASPLFVALAPDIIVNDMKVGEAESGVAFSRDAKAGRYRIETSNALGNPIALEVEESQTYFVRITPRLQLTGVRLIPEIVKNAEADNEVRALSWLPLQRNGL